MYCSPKNCEINIRRIHNTFVSNHPLRIFGVSSSVRCPKTVFIRTWNLCPLRVGIRFVTIPPSGGSS